VDRDLNITHLYNLGTDPYEMKKPGGRTQRQELKNDALKALLKDWMRSHKRDRTDPIRFKKNALHD